MNIGLKKLKFWTEYIGLHDDTSSKLEPLERWLLNVYFPWFDEISLREVQNYRLVTEYAFGKTAFECLLSIMSWMLA